MGSGPTFVNAALVLVVGGTGAPATVPAIATKRDDLSTWPVFHV